jgi:hypothetical protein
VSLLRISHNARTHMVYLDRFQLIIRGCHSTGTVYFTLNNPREVWQRRGETYLCMTLPGPHEPNLQQLNKIMSLVVKNMKKLDNGIVLTLLAQSDFNIVQVSSFVFMVIRS